MTEMIQEAVLESIESIDDAQLFAEAEVLIALADTYIKSALIQESNEMLDFDGYEVVQEAKTKINDTKDEAGKANSEELSDGRYTSGQTTRYEPGVKVKMNRKGEYTTKKDNWFTRFIRWCKDTIELIRKKFRRPVKYALAPQAAAAIVSAGGEIQFKSEEKAQALGLPMKPTKEDFSKCKRNIKTADVEITYKLSVSFNGFVKGFEHMQKSFDAWCNFITDPTTSKQHKKDQLPTIERERQTAQKWWSSSYGKNTEKTVIQLNDIEMKFSGIRNALDNMSETLKKLENGIMSGGISEGDKSRLLNISKKQINVLNTGVHISSIIYADLNGIHQERDRAMITGPGPKMDEI
jgi:hypothetical protein